MTRHKIDSFAICRICNSGSSDDNRSSGKLQLKPYFGYYSGTWITFDVRKNSHKIKVKIEGCQDSCSIPLRTSQPCLDLSNSLTRIKIKDLCLQYAHSTKPLGIEAKYNPRRLGFLCEKLVLLNLNEINSSILPPVSFSHLNPDTFCTQDVIIKIWFSSSTHLTRIERMKVRQGISVAELKWMLCTKLPMQVEPSKLDIYEYNSVEKLSETSYLSPNQVIFHCIVLSSTHRDSIIVSLVGQEIAQIRVEPQDTTLT